MTCCRLAPAGARPAEAGQASLRRELWLLGGAGGGGAGDRRRSSRLLLAFSRIPGIEAVFPWPIDFFHKGLVIHVVFSFVVWFARGVRRRWRCWPAHRLSDGRPRLDGLGLIAVGGSVLAMPLLFVPALLDRGEPTLNNYVPGDHRPALLRRPRRCWRRRSAVAALRLLVSVRADARCAPIRSPRPIAAAAVVYAAGAALLRHRLRGAGRRAAGRIDFNEDVMWGGGHILQFVNTLLLLVAWALLARRASTARCRARPRGVERAAAAGRRCRHRCSTCSSRRSRRSRCAPSPGCSTLLGPAAGDRRRRAARGASAARWPWQRAGLPGAGAVHAAVRRRRHAGPVRRRRRYAHAGALSRR